MIPQQQSTGVEGYNRKEQQPIADQHAEVLQSAPHHNTQQVRGEGDVRVLAIPKRIREDDVRYKYRREGQGARQEVAKEWVTQ